ARADGDPRPAWQTWLREAGELLGLASVAGEAPQADRPVTLTLARREQLNDPNDPVTHEAWALELTSAEPLDFRPGDLLLITPRAGEPARPYSIGSTPLEDPHRLLLTVAVTSRTDEQGRTRAGQVSSLLGRQLPIGASLHATLRRHEHLHPPEDPSQPIILIAAGCGIAPFIGFLAERERQPEAGPVWLIFGNRRRHGDFFHGERLLAWREQGVLTRLDLAFSRDEEDGSYIQDRLHEAGTELIAWLTQHGARLYACGRRNTVGEGVRATLAVALIEHELVPDADHADRQLAQWEQEGRLRFDVID
ncbi:MAG: nitric oxide synthase, partial [Halorhodospira sp.]